MKKNFVKKSAMTCLVSAVFLSLSFPALAGVVFEVETKDHSDAGRVETSHAYAEGKNLKMTISPGSGEERVGDEMIFRGDRREVVVVDSKNKVYMVFDENSAKELKTQTGGFEDQLAIARKELNKHLSGMSEEQKRGLEQALGNPRGGAGAIFGTAPQPTEVRNTGERAVQKGYPCQKWVVLRGGEKIRELWVTDWSRIEGGEEAKVAFGAMVDFINDLQDTGFAGAGFEEYEHFKEIDGFPVVTRNFEGGELDDETWLRSSRRRTLDPADFEPPSGYKRRSMMPGG